GVSQVFESNKGATAWRLINPGMTSTSVVPHVDQHAFAFAPDGTVYLGNDGGLWRYNPAPFDPAPTYYAGPIAKSGVVGDFNNDGKADIATINPVRLVPPSTVRVQINNGDGTFKPAVDYSANKNSSFMVAGDFNKDGWLDLAVANADTGDVSVLINNKDGT